MSGTDSVTVDVRDPGDVEDALRELAPSAVVHLAARHFIPDCEADPAGTLETNVLGTATVLGAAAKLPRLPRLVFASTADVYRPDTAAHAESSAVAPIGVYGLSKLAGEQLVGGTYSDAVVLRLFNLYGPGDSTAHLIPEILRQLPTGVVALGNLESRRDYVWVEDVAEVVGAAALGRMRNGTYNVGSGIATSGRDVLDMIVRSSGIDVELQQVESRLRASDRPNLQADCTALHAALPEWSPKPIADGLHQLVMLKEGP